MSDLNITDPRQIRARIQYAIGNAELAGDANISLTESDLHAQIAQAEALIVIAATTHRLVDLAQQLIDQLAPLQVAVRQPDTWPIGDH